MTRSDPLVGSHFTKWNPAISTIIFGQQIYSNGGRWDQLFIKQNLDRGDMLFAPHGFLGPGLINGKRKRPTQPKIWHPHFELGRRDFW